MIDQILYTVLAIIGFGGILLLSEYLYNRFNIDQQYTRKIAHSLAAFASLLFLLKIFSPLIVLIIALFFSFLLFIGKKKDYFRSIDSIHEKTFGSIFLPISIFVVYYLASRFKNDLFFILPVLILAICDPLAWLAGTYFKGRTKRIVLLNRLLRKTFFGSVVFFISAFIVILVTLVVFGYSFFTIIFLSLFVSGVDTFVEMISPYGTDNLLVPLVTAGLLILLL